MNFIRKNETKIYMFTTIIFTVILLMFHYNVRFDRADTIYFRECLEKYSLLEYVKWRYETITGRVFLEGILYIMLSFPYVVFAIINTLMIIIGVFTAKYLFHWSKLETCIFMIMLFVFPMYGLVEVGIQPGCINYIWALVCGLVAFIPIRQVIDGKKSFRWYEYIGYGVVTLIGCNMEQIAAVVTGMYLICLAYLFWQTKKVSPIFIVQLVVSILSLLFLLLGPSNALRMEFEINTKWPDFETLTFLEKIWNGWTTTIHYLLAIPTIPTDKETILTRTDVPTLIFLGILSAWLWIRWRKLNVFTFFGSVTFAFKCGIFAMSCLESSRISQLLMGLYLEQLYPNIPDLEFAYRLVWVYPQILIYSAFAIMVIIALFGAFELNPQDMLILLIAGIGFGTRMLMGFSPTLIASSVRTFLFLHISLYLCAIHFIHRIYIAFIHKEERKE